MAGGGAYARESGKEAFGHYYCNALKLLVYPVGKQIPANIGDNNASVATELRMLRHGFVARFDSSTHLQLRVHVLRELYRYFTAWHLPELWR